jgi:hypothetical protein
VVKIDKSKTDEGMYRVVLEGLVSHAVLQSLIPHLDPDHCDRYSLVDQSQPDGS